MELSRNKLNFFSYSLLFTPCKMTQYLPITFNFLTTQVEILTNNHCILPGVQLLGSTAKNIAESCEISPSVTLKEKSTSPYFFRFQKFIFDFDHSDSLVRLFTAHE